VEVTFYEILTSELKGGNLFCTLVAFVSRERILRHKWIGEWMSPWAGLVIAAKRKFPAPGEYRKLIYA
jgi:hypothetical protein